MAEPQPSTGVSLDRRPERPTPHYTVAEETAFALWELARIRPGIDPIVRARELIA